MPQVLTAVFTGPLAGPALALLLLVAWIGWGVWVWLSLRRSSSSRPDVGLLGASGLAASALLGGVYNLLGILSRELVTVHLLLGAAGFCIYLARRPWGGVAWRWPARAVVLGAVLGALLWIRLVTLAWAPFNAHDDHHAYLTFPVKMLSTGELGEDPFSQRRMQAGLGGQYFLLALGLAAGGLKPLNVVDAGAAGVLFVLLVLGHRQRTGAGAAWSAAAASLAVLIVPPRVNISSLMTGAVVLYALLRALDGGPREDPRRAMIRIAVLAAGLASLKASWVPVAGVVLAVGLAVDRRWGSRAARGGWLAATAAACGALLVPWMLAQRQASGTLLYPFLGRGFDGSVTSTFASYTSTLTPWRALVLAVRAATRTESVAVLALVLGLALAARSRLVPARIATVVGASWASGVALVVVSDGTPRFAFPVWIAAIAFGGIVLAEASGRSRGRLRSALAYGAAFALLLPWVLDLPERARRTAQELRELRTMMSRGPRHELDAVGDRYRDVQAALPGGVPILAHLSYPAKLDFAHHRFFVVDWPCGASPPPGLSCTDPAAAATYLCGQGIGYVLYDSAEEARFPLSPETRWVRSHPNVFWRTSAEHMFAFHEVLATWAARPGAVRFDDGLTQLIELACHPDQSSAP